MLLTWCKVFARAIRGHLRSEAQSEPPRGWRGEPLAARSTAPPEDPSYRTLRIDDVPDGRANSPDVEADPAPPEADAPGPVGRPKQLLDPTADLTPTAFGTWGSA
jgi:hypothetical protein